TDSVELFQRFRRRAMHRRSFIRASAAAATLSSLGAGAEVTPASSALDPFFDDLQARTFRFFWETTNPVNGLTPDRYPKPPFSSIAAVGFALTAYPIGVERGWVTRAAARQRVLATLRFFDAAPQGPGRGGVAGYRGFFYHFLEMRSGLRFKTIELSTIDTSLLLAGMLFCQSYFGGEDAEEAEIRRLAEAIYGQVDWRWSQQPAAAKPAITLGWTPEEGFNRYSWHGYNEGMIIYLLALGSPTHAVEPDAWTAWQRDFDKTWGLNYGSKPHIGYHSLFVHQYPHVWIDFRDIRDAYMRGRDLDYFENSRRATQAQRAYAIANPWRWQGYGEDIWGLTACDGPGDIRHRYLGQMRRFYGYAGRGPGPLDDGTLAPTAALGSIAFAPEICAPAALAMKRAYGEHVLGPYGFVDSFNPSFDFHDVRSRTGAITPGVGWIATDYLGIDQGPILAMLENWRSGLIWKVMRTNPHIARGLRRAGFTGGWLEAK
ncbi:MAG: glucoamylase family protein, partial [Caulobacteraceae bacterium]